METFAAIDLGASSGRVITGSISERAIKTEEIHRFSNGPIAVPEGDTSGLYWDIHRIWSNVLTGLKRLEGTPIESVGVDSWAVDYGLIGETGKLLSTPYSYRDQRTANVPGALFAQFPAGQFYSENGLQVLDFNTVFQLIAAANSPDDRRILEAATQVLLLPDLLNYWLSGATNAEVTNASSTGMINPATRQWSRQILDLYTEQTGLNIAAKLPPLIEAGETVGNIRPEVADLKSEDGTRSRVVAVGSHDTASAVSAIPASTKNFAYISCGTWSLVGLELDKPVRSEESRKANFTNELGIDGTVRYLHNIMGMWVLNGCVAKCRERDSSLTFTEIDEAAAQAAPLRTVVDINDPIFSAPGDMLARIDQLATQSGQPAPRDIGEYVRCIDESLAIAHARAIRQAASLADKSADAVHMVGGGTKNRLLCQLTADACGLPVTVGPVEATALGNLLVQARAAHAIGDSLAAMREVVRNSAHLETLTPKSSRQAWQEAEARIF